ncbi:MAG: single-stranded-DNA-specific exonuclease RecJ [Bacteroidota bacterium]|nr:single-stranded-DNA-specific exonuclease RecJ [Bacteroidota bacterium]
MAESLNINHFLAEILVQRGITNFDTAKSYFRPSLDDLHDPFLMKDMDKAVKRLNQAIEKNEKILIYGDYDVDGTTSVSLIYNYLINYHKDLECYIPDRKREGYGISYAGLDYAAKNGYHLIIALDCGIKAVDKVKYATEQNLDIIICDHHTPGETIPEAIAVLDPKRADCNYPYKHLSGCGVGFKLLQGFAKYNNYDEKTLLNYLDLVVVSIGSDIVPITGENRVLAHYGLKVLNHSPQVGLKTIIDLSNLTNKEIVISDIVFKIGPRINAAGRMESGSKAVDLLIAQDKNISFDMGNQINLINDERKTLDHSITDEAIKQAEDEIDGKNKKATVVCSEDWHKGVIGIVASRLIEVFFRPTIVLTESNGMYSGSARSVPGFNLYNAVEQCSDLLENFGGHMYAAGLTLKPENYDKFKARFEKYVAENITEEQLTPSINADLLIEVKHINTKFYKVLKQFAPYGPNNMKPVFISRHVFDNGQGKIVGKNDEHLKLKIIQHVGDNLTIDAIGFGFGQFYEKTKNYQPFDICYTIEENVFMGRKNLQMLIRDIKLSENPERF